MLKLTKISIAATNMNVFTGKDQSGNILTFKCENNNVITVSINKEELKNVQTLEFMPDFFNAKTGDDGYIYDINLEVDSYLPHTENSASDINESTSIDNIPQSMETVNAYSMQDDKKYLLGVVAHNRTVPLSPMT